MKKVMIISYILRVNQGGSELITKNLYELYLKENFDCLFLEIYESQEKEHYFKNTNAQFSYVQKGLKYSKSDLKKSIYAQNERKNRKIFNEFFKFKVWKILFRRKKTNEIIEKFSPDILYFVDLEGLKLVDKKYYHKSIVHIHVSNKVKEFESIKKFKNIKEVVVLTIEQKNMLTHKNVSVVANSIDPLKYIPYNEKYYNICIVGRINEVKRFDRIESIIKESLKDEILKKITYHIYGKLDDYGIIIHGKMQHYPNVIFHGLVESKEEIFDKKDLLLICSEVEGFSLVALESATKGINVISSNLKEITSVLNSIHVNIVENSDCIKQYLDLILNYYNQDTMMLNQENIKKASLFYSHEVFVNKMKEIFERM